MLSKETIQAEIKKVLDVKLRPRIDAEVKALLHARNDRDKISGQVRNIEARVTTARTERDRLEAEQEKQILQGNAPNALIRDVGIKKAEVNAFEGQIEKLAKTRREADQVVTAAEKTLQAKLWAELPAIRNEIEEIVKDCILEGIRYMKRWCEAFHEVYSEYDVRPDQKAEKRLSLFYGLQQVIQDLEPYTDADIDPLFAQAKRKSMGMRG